MLLFWLVPLERRRSEVVITTTIHLRHPEALVGEAGQKLVV